jgi:hypothetical protein
MYAEAPSWMLAALWIRAAPDGGLDLKIPGKKTE